MKSIPSITQYIRILTLVVVNEGSSFYYWYILSRQNVLVMQ